MCLKILWKGTRDTITNDVDQNKHVNYDNGLGAKFLQAVVAVREAIYHTSSYQSNYELNAILQRDIGLEKMSFKFYHRGILGDFPHVPEGIQVLPKQLCYLSLFHND